MNNRDYRKQAATFGSATLSETRACRELLLRDQARQAVAALEETPLLRVDHLVKSYPIRKGLLKIRSKTFTAVDDVSFVIRTGETLGIVGESGSGKTTTGRTTLLLEKPSSGAIEFDGHRLLTLKSGDLRRLRRNMQMIFQDPFDSLDSRQTIGEILEEPFLIHGIGSLSERKRAVANLLDRVGMARASIDQYPHEFSGGQRQRIGIARAIALKPKLIVCDEPVSSLDVSIQGQILNLLIDLQREMGLAYLFISHNLSVVKHVSDRIAVMYRGRFVETADAETIYRKPLHPYTRLLIASIPTIDAIKAPVPGRDIADAPPVLVATGCAFAPRCSRREDICDRMRPELVSVQSPGEPEHRVACHLFPGKAPSSP
ncbi:ABC transporter ATP-binding protein [Desulfatirhabdium butyrativorans]|uniref:ABC transporter ATP-binding protein n=1 Tax=Desulfatirhabdium butyrativorans TaxID=340467 RepID=UPI000A02BB4B|nr:oligopeptide/dipeptide ABC transporter ATP-binding protein [Desulfatirhabdium butyrativorans]